MQHEGDLPDQSDCRNEPTGRDFERLLLDFSTKFVNVAGKDFDAHMEDALRQTGEFLGLDRGLVTEINRDTLARRVMYVWTRQGVEPADPAMKLGDAFPWITKRLLAGNVVEFSNPDELPEEASVDRATTLRLGVQAHISVPLVIGSRVMGTVSFSAYHQHAWPPKLVDRLRVLAQLFASAVARQRADKEAERRLQFERLLSDLSSEFVNLPSSQVDNKIVDALQNIVEALDLDRGNLVQVIEGERFILTHSFTVPGAPLFVPQNTPMDMPWYIEQMKNKRIVRLAHASDLPADALNERALFAKLHTQSNVTIPLTVGDALIGAMAFGSVRSPRSWSDDVVDRMQLIAQVLANALARRNADVKLQQAFAQIEEFKDRLEAENVYLRHEVELEQNHEEIIGHSTGIKRVLSQIEQVARTNSTVLVLGETGTGKELVARAIHNRGARKDRLMVKVNCAALPATLIESELFGREKGAFTGALTKQVGRFEVADGSTIFLDEIGELPLELQAKLLRVLQDGEFERLGSATTIKVDARIVAATNRDLTKAVREGTFRQDLFYRLNVFPIAVPPLRERTEDIPLLVWNFVRELSESMGKTIETISRATMERLQAYPWPGNIRELRNVIEHAMILNPGPVLQIEMKDTSPSLRSEPRLESAVVLDEVQRNHILAVLKRTRWRVRGRDGAAELLGMKPTTLESRLQRLGIQRPGADK